ncbi:MAG: hypothetical protein FD177_188 [Desulfovibrionaceae bacterium]|nr:MAG: hypothetical protein FD177_188 [Desulfovibrionaceae bacterium]
MTDKTDQFILDTMRIAVYEFVIINIALNMFFGFKCSWLMAG